MWLGYHVPLCDAMAGVRSTYLSADGVFTGEMGAALVAAEDRRKAGRSRTRG